MEHFPYDQMIWNLMSIWDNLLYWFHNNFMTIISLIKKTIGDFWQNIMMEHHDISWCKIPKPYKPVLVWRNLKWPFTQSPFCHDFRRISVITGARHFRCCKGVGNLNTLVRFHKTSVKPWKSFLFRSLHCKWSIIYC